MIRRYSIIDLLTAVRRLPAHMPQSDRLPFGDYQSHKDHWIGWLSEYNTEGAYGRTDTAVSDARTVYQRLNNDRIIIWLNEAAGEAPPIIATAIAMTSRCLGNKQAKAKIARQHLPWERAATLLFRP